MSDGRSGVTTQELVEARELMERLGYSSGRVSSTAGLVASCLKEDRDRNTRATPTCATCKHFTTRGIETIPDWCDNSGCCVMETDADFGCILHEARED